MMKKKKIIKTFGYRGSKYNLIHTIRDYTPENIKELKVYDVFGGSGVVGVNLSDDIIYNEPNIKVNALFGWLICKPREELIKDITQAYKDLDFDH